MILCIVPDAGMAEAFKKIAPSFNEHIIVERGLLEEAVPVARRYENEADVIVSRGGTVLVMRNAGIATPIVELQVTAKDLALALEKARALMLRDSFKIGVISFSNMTQQLKDFLPFFNLDLRLYELGIDSDLEKAIRTAMADGMDVLMGGVITSKVSARSSVPAILIESGETSIRYALEEAAKIAAARRLQSRRAEELRIIMENIREGILATDGEGNIFQMNAKAKELFRNFQGQEAWGYGSKLPKAIRDIMSLSKGEKDREKRILIDLGPKRVMVDSIPVEVEGSVASSVITLQDVSRIQKMEEEIRREIYFKGYVAKFNFDDIIARDQASLRTIELAKRFARTNASILIRGESGVGKEMFAQSIHNTSERGSRAFVAMNCAAIPETLFESEMFGYVDGAFTGARKKGKPGLFEIAHGGTVFLDEISEMPLDLQARLLRVLQEHQVLRLGDDKIIHVDVRIIAASNRNLPALVAEGRFRNDLYWRINVLNLHIPPLRERKGDILPLVNHILGHSDACGKVPSIAADCETFLEEYSWPGNVRELKNFCERVTAICDEKSLSARIAMQLLDSEALSDETAANMLLVEAEPVQSIKPMKLRSKTEIRAIVEHAGSIGDAARILGIHRSTLWRRLKRG
jgi:transcriptional regulator with PAS, ATPase and Fis domain